MSSSSPTSSQASEPQWQEASPLPQPQPTLTSAAANTQESQSQSQPESDADMMMRHQQELEDMIESNFAGQDDDEDEDDEEDDEFQDIYVDVDEEDEEIDIDLDEEVDDFMDEDGQEEEIAAEEEEEGITLDLSQILQAAIRNRSGVAQEAPTDDSLESRTQRALAGISLSGLRRILAAGGIRLTGEDEDEEDEEMDDDDDDDDEGGWFGGGNRRGASSNMKDFWEPVKEPVKAGVELLRSGEFGRTPKRPIGSPPSAFEPSVNISDFIRARKQSSRRVPKEEMKSFVPNSNGTEVARYPAKCYIGQYSQDSSLFYTCTQDFRVQMYDTTSIGSKKVLKLDDAAPTFSRRNRLGYFSSIGMVQYTSLKPIKTIQGRQGAWTITDANLSPDNNWMIYSSINPYVHLVPTRNVGEDTSNQEYDPDSGSYLGDSDKQVMLDFSDSGDDDGPSWRSGIWSIRFSGDSREIVAGGHYGSIMVYDIEARKRVLSVEGHDEDVNGVCFADAASSNVLISGSDDTFVKVWDRRSLSGGKPAGVLPGHTEGITYVAPKGDGRYCISNGKDQGLKLWDLRMMMSSGDFDRMSKRSYGLRNWDYRSMTYNKPRFQSHPQDRSVMTFRGHAVLRTLIRCHFSPLSTTGQQYVYSGSADGKIHIWSLDGRIVQVLDRSKARPIYSDGTMTATDPSSQEDPDSNNASSNREDVIRTRLGNTYRSSQACTVRDVSWHSSEPSLMSTAWDGPDGERGSIAKHEWKGYGKNGLSLQDAIARSKEEAEEVEGRAL